MIGKVLGVGSGVVGGVAALAVRPVAVALGLIGVLVVIALCWTINNVERTKNLVSVIDALHGRRSVAERRRVGAASIRDTSLCDAPIGGAGVDLAAQRTGPVGGASVESGWLSGEGRRADGVVKARRPKANRWRLLVDRARLRRMIRQG
jgi:hypothetical protein